MNTPLRQASFCLLFLFGLAVAQADDGLKKPLDHSSYDQWNQISQTSLSRNGRWLIYAIRPGKGDTTVKVRDLQSQREYVVERGSSARFTYDSCYAMCVVQPDPDAVKAAAKAKKPVSQQPQPSVLILDLKTGRTRSVARARSFSLPRKASGWATISMVKEPAPATAAKGESKVKQVEEVSQEGAVEKSAKEAAKESSKKKIQPTKKSAKPSPDPKKESTPDKDKKEKSAGSELVLMNLQTGMQYKYPFVSSHRFSENGKRLVLATSVEKGETSSKDGITLIQLPDLKTRELISGPGNYRNLTFDESGELFAFFTDRDTYEQKKPSYAVYFMKAGSTKPTAIVTPETEGLKKGWKLAESSSLRFSKNGKNLFFNTAPIREEDKEEKKDEAQEDDEKPVKVDVWHWQDPWLQPMQLLRAEMEKRRTYLAVAHLDKPKVLQLANPDMPSVMTGDEGNARYALGTSDLPYRKLISWEYPGYQDTYLIDTLTGKTDRVLEKARGSASWSPKAKYITWWDSEKRAWFGMSATARKPLNLSAKIPFPVHNELHDTPSPPRAYGSGGWTDNDKEFLIQDRFDIWAVDPQQPNTPRCITDGFGRQNSIRFQLTRLDREARSVSATEPMILSAFNDKTKSSGFYQDQVTGDQKPRKLIEKNELISSLTKAEENDTVVFTRSTFQRFPDIWTSTLAFGKIKRISRANPQQLNYRWGSAELTQWKSADGQPLQGVLLKPDDFDPKKKYPLLVYFYERSSDRLHRYVTPAASQSIINFSFYVSRGYVLFIPDIPYKTGYPGKSAENAVLPGIAHIVKQGFVDEKKIGVQGHSWGGYQVAHLVTRTNIFAAAESGAPVSNMTSAYGGIRWSSGMSRMFQYEQTQSRIGGTLWEARDLYLENSPLFHADKIETPLLILHNDKDGAVPWYQGIELFVAMRRLSKPAWLINYNDEGHGVGQDQNKRDWSVRMQQFFDHYLKDDPAPKWLTEGVPATEKGKNLGLELVK